MSKNEDGPEDYEVGYGRPPRRTQYKAGQSGNPKGRPKGARSLQAYLREELDRKITVKEDGRIKRMSKGKAMAKTFVNKAVTGDSKAANFVSDNCPQLHECAGAVADDLNEVENAIFEAYIEKRISGGKK